MTTSVTTPDLRIHNAEQFIEALSEPASTNVYLTYGRVEAWANDSAPPQANSSILAFCDFYRRMIGGKKLTGNDLVHVIPRYDWATNTKYIAFDHRNPYLRNVNTQFYVVTSQYNVYKCLANNAGANSTTMPTSLNPNTITQTADGYVWKFMYQISGSEQLRFTTGSYMPVKTLNSDDNSLQWDVQENATDGAIYSIVITSAGTGYSNASNLVVTISGDGTGANATAGINNISNTVNSITITEYGQGYCNALATITGGGGSGATLLAIVGSPGGHGSDPLYELGSGYIMLNPRIINSESGVLPVVNDFRQIALMKNPLVMGSNVPISNTAFSQTFDVTVTGISVPFVIDEFVYQGASLSQATFVGKVVEWDTANSLLKLIYTQGSITSDSIVGANSTASRFVTSTSDPEVEMFSGKLLYMDNILPITRSNDQTENFQIVLKF
jgi:hypothetical protein